MFLVLILISQVPDIYCSRKFKLIEPAFKVHFLVRVWRNHDFKGTFMCIDIFKMKKQEKTSNFKINFVQLKQQLSQSEYLYLLIFKYQSMMGVKVYKCRIIIQNWALFLIKCRQKRPHQNVHFWIKWSYVLCLDTNFGYVQTKHIFSTGFVWRIFSSLASQNVALSPWGL